MRDQAGVLTDDKTKACQYLTSRGSPQPSPSNDYAGTCFIEL